MDWSRSLIQALDEGGMVWEDGAPAMTRSAALAEAEAVLAQRVANDSIER